jgi:hypothetical protein
MVLLVRAARVLLTLMIAAFALSLVIGLARPETGVVEKAVLALLIGACVYLAARVSLWSTKVQARLRGL